MVEIMEFLDLGNMTLVGLTVIGAVNALTIFRPETTSRTKFVVSVLVALVVGFIPANLGAEILNRLVAALEVAFAASGGYKIAQVIGPQPIVRT